MNDSKGIKRGRKVKEHADDCVCEVCYKQFCLDNGLKWEKK